MKRLAPLCLLLILSLAVSASAVKAPETVVGNGGCIAIIPCDQDATNVGMNMHAKLQSSDIWKNGGLGLRMVPLSEAKNMKEGSIGTLLYGTKTQGAEFSDDDPFECRNTLLIELWTPSCGEMPKICTDGNDKNIVELPNEYQPKVKAAPVHQYFFQDLDEKGISTGVFFKGAGFYMSCGGDENRGWDGTALPREKVLITGGTPAILEDVAMEFVGEVVKTKAEYSPEVKYRITDDWGQSMIVGFQENMDAMAALKDKIKDKYGHTPIVVTDGEIGNLAQVLMKVGRSGGGFLGLPSKMVDSRLYVVTSANTAYVILLSKGTDNLAYQLFANLNSKEYTDETIVFVDVYGCKPEHETFKTTDEFEVGRAVAVKKGKDLYIGENGAVCYFEVKDKGGCEALLIGEDKYKKGNGVYCEWAENGSLKGNKYQTGVYSKKSVDGGGELRLMAGLGECSTNEAVAEYKELSGAFDSGDRQWLPLCNDSKRFPRDMNGSMSCPYGESGYKANGYGGGVFSRAKYCACAMIVEKDMKIMTGRFTQEAYDAGMGLEEGPARLVAAIATISNDGTVSEFAERESGSSVTIDGPKFRVVPFAIDETLRRSYPPEITITYGGESRVWKSGYAEFDLNDGGNLRMESEGYRAYESIIAKGKGRLVAAIATISGDVAGEPVEAESGSELTIKGTGFRVRPFAIDARNLRVIPPEVTLTYKSLTQEQTKSSMNGKPVDFDIYFGGTLTIASEGYLDYSVKLEPPLAGTLTYQPNKDAWIQTTETTATISWGISKATSGRTSRIHYAYMPDSPDREAALKGGLDWKTETADFANGIWTVNLEGLKPDSEYLFWLDSDAIGYEGSFNKLSDEDYVEDWTFRTSESKAEEEAERNRDAEGIFNRHEIKEIKLTFDFPGSPTQDLLADSVVEMPENYGETLGDYTVVELVPRGVLENHRMRTSVTVDGLAMENPGADKLVFSGSEPWARLSIGPAELVAVIEYDANGEGTFDKRDERRVQLEILGIPASEPQEELILVQNPSAMPDENAAMIAFKVNQEQVDGTLQVSVFGPDTRAMTVTGGKLVTAGLNGDWWQAEVTGLRSNTEHTYYVLYTVPGGDTRQLATRDGTDSWTFKTSTKVASNGQEKSMLAGEEVKLANGCWIGLESVNGRGEATVKVWYRKDQGDDYYSRGVHVIPQGETLLHDAKCAPDTGPQRIVVKNVRVNGVAGATLKVSWRALENVRLIWAEEADTTGAFIHRVIGRATGPVMSRDGYHVYIEPSGANSFAIYEAINNAGDVRLTKVWPWGKPLYKSSQRYADDDDYRLDELRDAVITKEMYDLVESRKTEMDFDFVTGVLIQNGIFIGEIN